MIETWPCRNFEEINITETWRNIKIKFGNININIMDDPSSTFAGKQDKVFLVGAGKLENGLKYESICTFSDLMPDTSIKKYVKNFITSANIDKIKPEYIANTYTCTLDKSLINSSVMFSDKIDSRVTTDNFELYVILLLKKCCPNLNVVTSFFEFILFRNKIGDHINSIYTAIYEYTTKTGSMNFFDNIIQLDKNHASNIPDPNVCDSYYKKLNILKIDVMCGRCDLSDDIGTYKIWCNTMKEHIIDTSSNKGSNQTFNANITSLTNTVSNEFSDFMSIINSNIREKGSGL